MRKIMVLAAMLAMMMVASSPAMADEIDIDSDDGVVFTSEFTGDSDDVEDFFDEIEDEEFLFFSDFYGFDEDDFDDDDDDDDDESFVIFDSEDSDFDELEFGDVVFS
ncbi:MAG: hypothetical protein AVDCRST_MAG93-4159 [uncultured Chloroflexia bacterium]|uniref:Uncharacterized protein n=1 Tax=uncultured Chloroflexia bacterium TaxID=1672391 RepID=A0A6J4K3C7_9CHLR|nr:MAG: hypothetical protein AVDCRST_MAG93-4159 [uncultured Chloroflexia bacterium]